VNDQESLYQPRESIWITHYAVKMIVDSLPVTAASTATVVLPQGAKMKFDWLIVSNDRIARKEFFDSL